MALAEREFQQKYIYRERPDINDRKRREPDKKRRLPKGLYIIKLLFVALIAFFLLFRFSTITESQYRLSKLQSELKNTQAENEKLKVEIANLRSVARVEDIARNKLNMIEPDSHQIIYLNEN